MNCNKCGKFIKEDASFCPQCGTPIRETNKEASDLFVYSLVQNANRTYSITVNRENLLIEGDFWYLNDKEFCRCKEKQGKALVKNFIGMGYLAKRSFKKCLTFVAAGSLLEVFKLAVDKLTEWADKANQYLQWVDKSIVLPEWIDYTMNGLAVICIIFGISLFISKKKVIEISFTDKRICVPQNSMSKTEYHMLYESITSAKKWVTKS